MELELFKAVHRERIQGPAQLSPLPRDFYPKLRAYLKGLKDPAKLAKARASAHDLLTLRIGKILDLTATTSLPPGVEERLTPEELYLYRRTLALVEEFRRGVVEG
jgi:DNA replication initiation complex subunit (GINS family)